MKTKPTLQSRRKFLRTSMLGAASTWTLPVFREKTFFALDALAADATQAVTGKDGTILVVLQMAGGNDGLNMLVPYADDAYHIARPRLRLAPEQVLKINNHIALNPKLSGLNRCSTRVMSRSSKALVIQIPIVRIFAQPKS